MYRFWHSAKKCDLVSGPCSGTQFAGEFDCKLVKHCVVTLEGIGARQNTAFQLSSANVVPGMCVCS